ncbi:MAG: UbiD family decarboxylase [Firmicutes bacterium]|nr:UbiD family decarboxylase [Bacillota bacterium]
MAYPDLRAYLSALEERGLLSRVSRPVDKDWEISAVCRVNFRDIPSRERTALFFEQVKGYGIPVVAGILGGSDAIYATALETSPDKVLDKWAEGVKVPKAPVMVSQAPCQEVVWEGEEADLERLPHPTWTVGQDPGPYVTAGAVISKDPENGIGNVGTYRLQIKGPRKAGLMASARQGIAQHIRKNEAAGRPTEIAVVIGADPVIGLVSVTGFPQNHDELAIAGGIRGEPVAVTRGRTVDLLIPATAEIVIEGRILPGVREPEGPFGEYLGYMGEAGNHYVVEVTAITHRKDPIYQAFVSQMPPSESSLIRRVGRSLTLLRHLRDTLGLPVTNVLFPEPQGAGPVLFIAMKKGYEGHPVQAMHGAWALMPSTGKVTVVVDEDIDVWDPDAVLWAIATRVHPDRDLYIQGGTVPLGLDPAQPREGVGYPPRQTGFKIGIDATKKGTYPAPSVPPDEHLAKVRSAWELYGVQRAQDGRGKQG